MTTDGGERRSRRPSATSSSSNPEPREAATFFIDRSLGRKRFPAPLREAGLIVEIHDDHFASNVDDEVWLSEIGKRGWIAVTKDKRIRSRTIEREALVAAGVRTFILTSGNVPASELAATFLRALPGVRRLLKTNPGPFIARINRGSNVKVLVTVKKKTG